MWQSVENLKRLLRLTRRDNMITLSVGELIDVLDAIEARFERIERDAGTRQREA